MGIAVAIGSLAACGGGTPCPNDLPGACPSTPPSYARDISQVISTSCFPCHAPGGVEAVKPLTNYQQVFDQRGSVLDQVYHCRMPLSGSQLTATQRADLLAWLVCNAPDN
jgi:hypothetical protein